MNSPVLPAGNRHRGAWLSLISYVVLAAAKLIIGYWGHSSGLVADGFNNTTDVIASVTVLFGLRIAVQPPDADHRYGHARAESIAAILVAVLMGLIGLNVLVNAVQTALQPAAEPISPVAAWVGAAAAIVMFSVAAYNRGLAARTGSQAIAAMAHDNQSDAYTSIGTVVGVLANRLGVAWVDPLVALVIGAVIVATAWKIGQDASHTLMDGFDTKELKEIKARALGVPGVTSLREVRARHLGSGIAVEMTISVEDTLTIVEAHDICDQVEQRLRGFQDITHIHVHVEPH